MRRYLFDGGTAVITGAASGIGAALARGLADRGSHLVLLDRDGQGVAGVAEAICATLPQLRIATYVVDLADADATARIGETLATTHPDTTLLVNNAGVALAGRVEPGGAPQVGRAMAGNLH